MVRSTPKRIGCHILKKIGTKKSVDYHLYVCTYRPDRNLNPLAVWCVKLFYIDGETGEEFEAMPGSYPNHDDQYPVPGRKIVETLPEDIEAPPVLMPPGWLMDASLDVSNKQKFAGSVPIIDDPRFKLDPFPLTKSQYRKVARNLVKCVKAYPDQNWPSLEQLVGDRLKHLWWSKWIR